MAESVQQKCSNCKKMGMVRCDGYILFEQVCSERDSLYEQINNPHRVPTSNNVQPKTLLAEINQWESKTVRLVKQTADHARQQVNEMINSNTKVVALEFEKISSELRRHKDDDDYFEQDIQRLSKKLEQIQIDLKRPSPQLRINIKSIDWSTLVEVIIDTPKYNIIRRSQKKLFAGGTLLTFDHQIQLNQFYGKKSQRWRLIYKATKNGFDPKVCHQCCDRQGPTLTVIQSSEGYLFGGHTTVNWDTRIKAWINDKTAFLFTLLNPHNIPPTKYNINTMGTDAILSCFVQGPAFGQWDICIYLQETCYNRSHTRFPSNYIDTTGKGYLTFTGSSRFSINDVEIYRLASN